MASSKTTPTSQSVSSSATHPSQAENPTNPAVPVQIATQQIQAVPQYTPQILPSLNQPLAVKQDSDNYLMWKNQLLNVIIANGLENFIDGTNPCPARYLDHQMLVENPQFTQWQRTNRLVMSWLYASLTESVMAHIVSHNTAFDI